MDKYLTDPAWAQAGIAFIALGVSIFALIVAGVVAYLQWSDRKERKREAKVPGFGSHVSKLSTPNWYAATIVMRNFGSTQVVLERIEIYRPRRVRIVYKKTLHSYADVNGPPKTPSIEDAAHTIKPNLSLAPMGSQGKSIDGVHGVWPGTRDHGDVEVFIYSPPSLFRRSARVISLRMLSRRKDRQDSLISELIRINIPI